jgi:hypothetical protein
MVLPSLHLRPAFDAQPLKSGSVRVAVAPILAVSSL